MFTSSESTRTGEEDAHFGEKSVLKGYLMELGKEDVLKAGVLDYPQLPLSGMSSLT